MPALHDLPPGELSSQALNFFLFSFFAGQYSSEGEAEGSGQPEGGGGEQRYSIATSSSGSFSSAGSRSESSRMKALMRDELLINAQKFVTKASIIFLFD